MQTGWTDNVDHFAAGGIFWLPGAPHRRVPGELRFDADGVELLLHDSLEEFVFPQGQAGSVAPEWKTIPVVQPPADQDDTLVLLFLCCHPTLSPASQLALTLRAVGGLTTAEIAAAFLVPEATMAQRISRAKQRIRTAGGHFELPPLADRAERLGVVLHVRSTWSATRGTPPARGRRCTGPT